MGTAHLLEAACQCASTRVVVIITSDKCYENQEWAWGYRENDKLGGKDPYSCSKACAELVVNSYRESFLAKQNVNVATARAGNVIGGGDWGQDRLLPDLLTAFSQKELVTIRYPNAIRPWQHVCEPLNGYLGLARKLFEDGVPFTQGWNFGPCSSANKKVSWIADYIQRKWPDSLPWRHSQEVHPQESQILKLDNSAARGALDWHPVLSVEQALDWTVNWYQAWQEKRNMKHFTSNQIKDFIKLKEENHGK
jgi:CDP-glucose 4,6-dehydratase